MARGIVMASIVKCSNCKNYSKQLDECVIWHEAVAHANQMGNTIHTLFKEIGGMVDADSERICRHFSGDYPFAIGE